MGWSLPLSGVIRREALLETSLYRNYSGADKVLLAELALQGRFHEIGEELFAKRMHRGWHPLQDHPRARRARGWSIGRHPPAQDAPRLHQNDPSGRSWRPQRLHCMVTIVGMARRREVWRRLVVPGPDNFLGIVFRRQILGDVRPIRKPGARARRAILRA